MTMVPGPGNGYPISLGGSVTAGGLNESANIELGQSSNQTITMNDNNVRTLAGVSTTLNTGWSMSSLYGTSSVVPGNVLIATTGFSSYTLPRNAGTSINILAIGGGGGGGGGSGRDQSHQGWSTGGGGGGAGATPYVLNVSVSLGATLIIYVGTGGGAGVTRDGIYTSGSDGGGALDSYVQYNGSIIVDSFAAQGGLVAPNASGGRAGISYIGGTLLTPINGQAAVSGTWHGGLGAPGYTVNGQVGAGLSQILTYGVYGQTFSEYSGIPSQSGTGYGAGGSGGGTVQSDQGAEGNANASAGRPGCVFIWWGYY